MNAPAEAKPRKGMSTCLIVAIVVGAIGVVMLLVMVPLAIYGMRRYLAAAKTAEAKNYVGAISRAAVSAYEREQMTGPHRLCGSAVPVPTIVPAARKYLPSTSAGADYNTGSDTAGWKCLKFVVTEPTYYQYQYHAGSGWVVPSNAPGPNGFEAAAVGDLNGDGVQSHFARTGVVQGDSVRVSTTLYVDNELE